MTHRPPGTVYAVVLVLVTLLRATARGDKPKDPDAVDPATLPKDLEILSDGGGHYLALSLTVRDHLYYGDGKSFWHQRVISSGASPAEGDYSWRIWAPMSPDHADLELADGARWTMTCSERETPLHRLDDKDTRALLAKVAFRKELWRRQSVLLARDERGRYYFADRLRDEFGGKGLRLFIGKKGRLVEQAMIDTVWDTAGLLLEIKAGKLHADLEKGTADFVVGKAKEALIFVPPIDNRPLIYGELGVYRERLGVPCDDL